MKPDAEMQPERNHFKAAGLFHPGLARLQVVGFDPRPTLTLISFLGNNEARLAAVNAEWPTYRALADSTSAIAGMTPEQLATWWEVNQAALPAMFEVARLLLLGQPSAGAPERVFSVLKASFTHLQMSSLKDLVELVVMIKYNDSQRRRVK